MGTKGEAVKITKRVVDSITAPAKGMPPVEVWDAEVKGFHVRVPHSGRAVYRCWFRTGGVQKVQTLGVHGAVTAEQARERARAVVGAVSEGRDPVAERKAAVEATKEQARRAITLAQLAERWLVEGPDAAPTKRARSWETDARCLRLHILPLLGRLTARDLTRDDIQKAQRAIISGKTAKKKRKTTGRGRSIVRGGAGIARRSVASLSSLLSWAVDQEIITTNVATRVKKPPQNKKERFLSEAEVARLFDALSAMEQDGALLPVHGDVFRTLLLTGARRSEISALRWDEVDLGRGLATLGAERHKAGGHSGLKHIILNAAAAAIISKRPREGELVFPAPSDAVRRSNKLPEQGCNAGLAKAWQRVRLRADLSGVRLHDLRHSYASFAAAGGASLLLIGKALGHTQAATTARYSHLGHDPVRDMAEKVGRTIMGGAERSTKSGDVVILRR